MYTFIFIKQNKIQNTITENAAEPKCRGTRSTHHSTGTSDGTRGEIGGENPLPPRLPGTRAAVALARRPWRPPRKGERRGLVPIRPWSRRRRKQRCAYMAQGEETDGHPARRRGRPPGLRRSGGDAAPSPEKPHPPSEGPNGPISSVPEAMDELGPKSSTVRPLGLFKSLLS